MKTLFKFLMLISITVYLFFAFTHFNQESGKENCVALKILVTDSLHAGFITPTEVDRILRSAGVYPVGKPMRQIESMKIENLLLKNPFIKEATVYKTANNNLHILITQRLPLLRIMADNGDNYYIDEHGQAMNPMGYVADLAVATGHINKKYAKTSLAELGRFLRKNAFWDQQIEQIYVDKDQRISLVPRVGNQIIRLGTTDSISKKFRNLRNFYEKVLPTVGWNKYQEINIAHTNQIVCVKTEY